MRTLFFLFFAALCSPALAAEPVVHVSMPWAPPSLNQPNGVGFMGLHAMQDDALLSARSDCCTAVELHTHVKDGDVVRMRKVASIPLPAEDMVMLRPGGYHLMLIGLKKPLKDGDSVPVTLQFKHAPEQNIELMVDRQKLLDRLKTSREQDVAPHAHAHH
ncbi:MAG: hypothetical protein DI582_04195 [Azospirillum brasilense]|nr:MAG: hypothetical protein DI582_04195 [Azospirillum brasilense]